MMTGLDWIHTFCP